MLSFQITKFRFVQFFIICIMLIFVILIYFSTINSTIFYPNNVDEIILKTANIKPAVIVVIEKENQLETYHLAQSTLACYCKIYGYKLIPVVIEKSPEIQKLCPQKHIWFQRICAALRIIQLNSDIQYFFYFDADIGVINPKHRLEDYINPKYDLSFYQRVINYDIMTGSFIIKNTKFSIDFILEWLQLETTFTVTYGTNDLAALHQMFLTRFYPNHPKKEKCEKVWINSDNSTIDGHNRFVACSRLIMDEKLEYDKIIIYPKASEKAWVRDIWLTKGQWAPRDFFLHDMEQFKISNDPEQLKRDYLYYPNPFLADAIFHSSHCTMPEGLNSWKYNSTLITTNEIVLEQIMKKAKEADLKYHNYMKEF